MTRETVSPNQWGYMSHVGLDGTNGGRQSLGGTSWTHQSKLAVISTENTCRVPLGEQQPPFTSWGRSIIFHVMGMRDLPSGISVPSSFGIFGGMLFPGSSLTFFLLGKALTIPCGSIGPVGSLAAAAEYQQERGRLLRTVLDNNLRFTYFAHWLCWFGVGFLLLPS